MSGLYRTPPIYIAEEHGASFTDVDGNDYLDFNLCELSMTIGYGNEAVAAELGAQARRGAHFLLPTEDALVVSQILATRMGLPFWQFTLSASGANAEVIRIAQFMTARPRIVVFGGHYHGHIEETLVREEAGPSVPDTAGPSPGSAAHTTILPFNDLNALERTLSVGDVALVLTEPVMTNCNVILPDPDCHCGVRELTSRYGTLLCIDKAHTFQFAFSALCNAWRLASDFLVLGKGFGSGVAFWLYGMSDEVAACFIEHLEVDIGPRGIATGGTTYASAPSLAVARVVLEKVMTAEAYDRVRALGGRLADEGLEVTFEVALAIGVVPEADGHRRDRPRAHEFSDLTHRRPPTLVECHDRSAEVPALHLADVHWRSLIADEERSGKIGAPGDICKPHIRLHFGVDSAIAVRRKRRTRRTHSRDRA